MDYQIQITESLQRVATVSADSEIEAIELVRRLYKEEKIVLDSEDFTDTNFIVKNQNLKTYYQSEKGTLSLLMATVSNFSKSLISSST